MRRRHRVRHGGGFTAEEMATMEMSDEQLDAWLKSQEKEKEDEKVRACTRLLTEKGLIKAKAPAAKAKAPAAKAKANVGAVVGAVGAPRNFINEGNSCFIAASLQMLAAIPQLAQNLAAVEEIDNPFAQHLARLLRQIAEPGGQDRIRRGEVSELAESWNKHGNPLGEQIDPWSNSDAIEALSPFVHFLIKRSPALWEIFAGWTERSEMSFEIPSPAWIMIGPHTRTPSLEQTLAVWARGDKEGGPNRIQMLNDVLFVHFAELPARESVPLGITCAGKRLICRAVICYIDSPQHYFTYVVQRGAHIFLCNDLDGSRCTPVTRARGDNTVPINPRYLEPGNGIKYIVYSAVLPDE